MEYGMSPNEMIKPEDIPGLLRSRFEYHAETGKFFWKPRAECEFPSARISRNWNTRFAGKEAFTRVREDGYTRAEILIDGRRFRILGHIAAFSISYGRMPDEEIDHINRERADNRLENLREATRLQNARNIRRSGQYLPGAHPFGNRWEARIFFDRKARQIGVYETEGEAHLAYVEEKQKLHGQFSPFPKGSLT